jgi:hypothetical protein
MVEVTTGGSQIRMFACGFKDWSPVHGPISTWRPRDGWAAPSTLKPSAHDEPLKLLDLLFNLEIRDRNMKLLLHEL